MTFNICYGIPFSLQVFDELRIVIIQIIRFGNMSLYIPVTEFVVNRFYKRGSHENTCTVDIVTFSKMTLPFTKN